MPMHELLRRLYPICRSITGDGVRETLGILSEIVPLEIHEIASGTPVFDWTIPDEWNVRAAWIKGPNGKTLVDFAEHNLHLVSYSTPVRAKLTLDELQPHLHSDPERPERIPYRTSYYAKNWGFCLPHALRERLPDGEYEVRIDTTLEPGSLSYGEFAIPGAADEEILIYSHCCHPSLANDNLSGLVVNTHLAKWLSQRDNHYGYRFVFGPGTIGSICWLSLNESRLLRIVAGLVSVLLGGGHPFTYKTTRDGDAGIDEVVRYVLEHSGSEHRIVDFEPYGYDERQFNSPGIALAAGRLSRAPNGAFDEYHSSADNPDFVSAESLRESLRLLKDIVTVLDANHRYVNLQPKCEPQLGRRGLYAAIGGDKPGEKELAMLWLLNRSDGTSSLLDIARAAELPFSVCKEIADLLEEASLLGKQQPAPQSS